MNFKKQRKNKGPLSDMKILDCTQVMAGPFCTMLLADMGATVVKVENPDGGDPMRTHGPEYFKNGTAAFLALNRNKKSLAIDLKTIQGKRIFKKLIPSVSFGGCAPHSSSTVGRISWKADR